MSENPVVGRGRGRGSPRPTAVEQFPGHPGHLSNQPSTLGGGGEDSRETSRLGSSFFGRGTHRGDLPRGLSGIVNEEGGSLPVGPVRNPPTISDQEPCHDRPNGVGRAMSIPNHNSPTTPGVPFRPRKYPHTVHELKEAPPLHGLRKNDFVYIIAAHPTKLNRLYIVRGREHRLHRLLLADAISTHLLKGGESVKYGRVPSIGHIVLVPSNVNRNYLLRCRIDQVFWAGSMESSQVQVTGLDTGLEFYVELEQVLSVNEEIMSFPPICYDVEVAGVPESSDLIRPFEINDLIQKEWKVRMGLEVLETKEGYSWVNLIRKDTNKSFADDIMKLEVWQWERILGLGIATTDDEIKKRGIWVSCPPTVVLPKLPRDTFFDAEVVGNFDVDSNRAGPNVIVYVKPLTFYMRKLEKTLEAQTERYMAMVEPSPYYPAINEQVFIRPPAGARHGEKWLRMLRFEQISHGFYALDKHDMYDIPPSDQTHKYRQILPEFNLIPQLVRDCALRGLEIDNPEIQLILKSIFRKGNMIQIKVKGVDEAGVDIIQCRELDSAMARL